MEKINVKELAGELAKNLQEISLYPDVDLENYINKARLDITKEYEKPITLISVIEYDNNEEKLKNRDCLTTGNISATIGAAKSKKTFFSTILLSALLNYDKFALKGNAQGLNVIFFDTEQSGYHVQTVHKRLKRLGAKLESLEIFVLRPYSTELRLAIIEYYLKQQKGKYSFVIIDGVVDLIYDFNDLRESVNIVDKLMAWSAIYNCHINSILHTNKDKAHARGHLGTALTNKAETVFKIEKEDNNTSKVICEYSRNRSFDSWNFSVEKGLPKRHLMPEGYYDNNPIKQITVTDDLPF